MEAFKKWLKTTQWGDCWTYKEVETSRKSWRAALGWVLKMKRYNEYESNEAHGDCYHIDDISIKIIKDELGDK